MPRFAVRPLSVSLVAVGALALVLDGDLGGRSAAALAAYVVLAVATCLPILYLDRAPRASVLLLELGLAACVLSFHPVDAAVGILTVALFMAAVRGDRRQSLTVGVATALLLAATVALLQRDGQAIDTDAATRVLIVLASIILGDAVRSRRALLAVRAERAASDHREREQRSQRRLAQERIRIARELHDTLAHALVAINVRSGVASHLGPRHDAAAALADIKDVSAQALRDLRGTLDLLRDPGEAAPRAPGESLESLPRLIDGVRSAGLDAHAEVHVEDGDVPAPVGQAAFRIVQEALTNVMRHANASSAEVTVLALADTLEVEVVDDGVGLAAGGSAGGGYGLHGMSERAAALGGTLTAGPRAASGWCVRAELPLTGGLG